MGGRLKAGIGIVCSIASLACSSTGQTGAVPPEESGRAFRDFIAALDNTLVEVNELERMGGGIRDRMILVDPESLVKGEDEFRLASALRLNYGKIRSLRSSLQSNEGVHEVLDRNGHSVRQLVAIDAKPQGVVILYVTR